MELKFNFNNLSKSPFNVVFTTDKKSFIHGNQLIDKSATNALEQHKGFDKNSGFVTLNNNNGDILVVCGISSIKTEFDIVTLGGKLYTYLNCLKTEKVNILTSDFNDIKEKEFISFLSEGLKLRSYKFNKYFVRKAEDHKSYLKEVFFNAKDPSEVKNLFSERESIVNGIYLARDLLNEPANVLYPETFAERCKELESLGIKVTVLGEKELKNNKMEAILSIGQGSNRESKVVIMEYNGGEKGKAPVALVGKGVCFDTGGINLKPYGSMIEEMKYDMGGAATVTGTVKALALRKANANVVGIIGLVENMISSKATRPSDVVNSMSGQTIEIDNTDAEGRVVLADVLWYLQERFETDCIIDLATLTGSMIVSLGSEICGMFSNDDSLSDKLLSASKKTGETLWRMPISDVYDRQINSMIADVKNTGKGREAGACTAAQFLYRFIKKGRKWAHLDIAGVAWDNKAPSNLCEKGGRGFGIRLLDRFVKENYEI